MQTVHHRVLTLALLSTLLAACPAAELWVDGRAGTNQNGTAEHPFASPAKALRRARELRRTGQVASNETVRVRLHGGTYFLTNPLLLRTEDSGTEPSPTVIEAAPNERPVLSGGVPVTGWRKVSRNVPGLSRAARNQVWVSEAPRFNGQPLTFRQLWVNDRKAVRARQPNGETLDRMVSWNRKREQASIPASAVQGLRLTPQLEMFIHQQWEIAICRVKNVRIEGDAAILTFQAPESQLQFEHPWPQPVMSTNGNAPYFLANAMEFLDEPGEWFQELPEGKVYYWPRRGEDMKSAEVIAPALETLVKIEGSAEKPVRQVQFKGIGFAHTTWLRPSEAGHVPLQAGMFLLDAYKLSPPGTPYHRGLDNLAWVGRPPGAAFARFAEAVVFTRCRFEHLAASGLDYERGTRQSVVEGCVFRDIGINGIQLGVFSDEATEAHLPYSPVDERELSRQNRIANNLVTDCANEDWGGVGIGVGFGRDIAIEHNEVNNVSYTGISVGWGWNKLTNCMSGNRVVANHVHHVATRMCDTAGIYTLSSQPGTLIAENHVHDIHMTQYVFNPQHWFYLYLDEGSSFMTVRDNWCPEEKFLKNANGPGNAWENNGPKVSTAIKEAAGLQPAFKDILPEDLKPLP